MSWIKVDTTLINKPELVQLSRILRKKREEILGYLIKFWCLVDGLTEDGSLPAYDKAAVDELVNLKGFGKAMQVVGWLEFSDESCTLSRFEKHNGSSAKKRAENALRQSRFRNVKHNKRVTQTALQGALPREEKRRSNNSGELLPRVNALDGVTATPPLSPPSLDAVYAFANGKGWQKDEVYKWWLWHDARGWTEGGRLVKWPSSLALWMTRVKQDDESKHDASSAKTSAPIEFNVGVEVE